MNLPASETFIPTMVDRIVEGVSASTIVLFGSHARGTATEWSEVDLLVILPNVVHQRDTTAEIRRAGRSAGLQGHRSSDSGGSHPSGHLGGTVLRSALREGRVVYERP